MVRSSFPILQTISVMKLKRIHFSADPYFLYLDLTHLLLNKYKKAV